MSNENITALMPGTHFNFKGFEWIVLDNNVDMHPMVYPERRARWQRSLCGRCGLSEQRQCEMQYH